MVANDCAKKLVMCNAAISVHLINIRNSWYKILLIISLNLYQELTTMKLSIEIKYFHPGLKIGLENIRDAWLLTDVKDPKKLQTIIHQGNLYYRIPGSGKRISYRTLKKGLIKKSFSIPIQLYLLPF